MMTTTFQLHDNPLLSCFTAPTLSSPTATQIVKDLEHWCQNHLTDDILAQHWEAGTFPTNCWSAFKRTCFVGYPLQNYHRLPSHNMPESDRILLPYLLTKTLARFDASFTTAILVQYGLCAASIAICGSNRQKEEWLPKLASLQLCGCFGLTEPQSGSDASQLQTTATKKNGVYVLNGSKRWIGNADMSDVLVIWARNLDLPGHPVMGFVLEKRSQPNPNCIRITKISGKTSLRMVQNANIELVNAICPLPNVLQGNNNSDGRECIGFSQSVGRVLEASRLSVAWIPVGICEGALQRTLNYLQERTAFGSPLTTNQLVQERLVKATSMVASMHLLAERLTLQYHATTSTTNHGNTIGIAQISMIKAYNSWLGRQVVSTCRELMGGNGLVLEYGLASKVCDMEAIHTYEGTYDICTLVAGRALTGHAAIVSGMGVQHKLKKKKSMRSKL